MKNFFESLNVKSLLVWLVIISLGVLGAGLAVKAYNGQLFGDCNNCTINVQGAVEAVGDALLGASGTRFPNGISADSTSPSAGQVRGSTLTITGAATAASLTTTGAIAGKVSVSNLSNAVTTTTLATTNTGNVYNITSSTNFVLPSTSTNSGVWYRFVIGGAITSNVTIHTSDDGNDIEGAMIVAGAVVDCDAEDTITFVADGENIGDYIEVYGNGTDWLIGSSGALTSSKMTCTTST